MIANQGDSADHFFLLVSGRARYFYLTSQGRKMILRWLTPGDIWGQAALLSRPSEYLIGTEAVHNSSVLVWDRASILGLIARIGSPVLVEDKSTTNWIGAIVWSLSFLIGWRLSRRGITR